MIPMDISAKFESISLLSIPSDQRIQTLVTAVAVAMCHRVADGYDFKTDINPLVLRVCGLMRPVGVVLVDTCIDHYRRMYNAYFQYTLHPASQLRVMTTGTTPYPELDKGIAEGLSHMEKIPGLFELILEAFDEKTQSDVMNVANESTTPVTNDFDFGMLTDNPFHAGRILGVTAYLAGVVEEDRAIQLFDVVANSHPVAVADAYKAYCAAIDTHSSAFNVLDLTRAFIKGNYDYVYGSIPREYRDDMDAELVDSNKQYSDLIGWIQTWNTNTPRT